jgi:hypothetical protein
MPQLTMLGNQPQHDAYALDKRNAHVAVNKTADLTVVLSESSPYGCTMLCRMVNIQQTTLVTQRTSTASKHINAWLRPASIYLAAAMPPPVQRVQPAQPAAFLPSAATALPAVTASRALINRQAQLLRLSRVSRLRLLLLLLLWLLLWLLPPAPPALLACMLLLAWLVVAKMLLCDLI